MSEQDEPPSKSARKRASDDLQALGEELVELPESELEALPLPDVLRDAVMLARRITAHGGLYRQKQYIGKLMRKIDAEPIRIALETRHERERIATLRFRRVEQWRDRIVREGRPALDEFVAECGGLTPEATKQLGSLTDKAHREHLQQIPAVSARELFRKLREAMAGSQP
jgi:ribosome-associated protein